MEELERKRLHWQKVTAVVCILLLIVVTASSALAFVGVRRYAPRIEHIVSRLDSVTAELDALDTQRLARVNFQQGLHIGLAAAADQFNAVALGHCWGCCVSV